MKPKLSGKKIDWMITLVPLGIVVALCVFFFFMPEQSNAVLSQIRFFFGDTFGTYYLVIGLGIFLLSLFIACSKYGNIVLGFHDVHLRPGGGYPFLLLRGVDSLRHRPPH